MEVNKKYTVLIVDDNAHNLQVLAEIIEESGYEPVLAMSGSQTFEFLRAEKPDLILLDVMMPEMDGYEVCKLIKNDENFKNIPVIFLTAKTETEDVVKGFSVGSVDYVTKPFKAMELKLRIKTHLELKRSRDEIKLYNEQLEMANKELHKVNNELNKKNIQLKEIMQKLEVASQVDPLTNLFNRRRIMEKIQEEVVRYKRNGRFFSIVMIDIDDFKMINDEYGHSGGDYVLKEVSRRIDESVRQQDSVSRWGGEEFLILLPETGIDGARMLAERVRKNIKEYDFIYEENKLSVTVTIGGAIYDGIMDIDDVIKHADCHMYEGKKCGKNCVVCL